ncbi:MAG: endo-1,4-beta-xylanase [Gemmataceae bacterium]
MGIMNFVLPAQMNLEAAQELERACIIGGPDNMPWPAHVTVESHRLSISRDVDESGNLVAPWDIAGLGRFMTTTGTLTEREASYFIQVELARGKVNQLRNQAADWRAGGLQVAPVLARSIHDLSMGFARVAATMPDAQAARFAEDLLVETYRVADELVQTYIDQVFQVRHHRQPRLDTALGCRVNGSVIEEAFRACFQQTFNRVCLPISWKDVEPNEDSYCWDQIDRMLDWASTLTQDIMAGPLIDFSPVNLPNWLWLWDRDLGSVASFMCDYVEHAVKRYKGRISCWQLTSASNYGNVLALSEDEMLWLNVRLAEAARQIDPSLELVVGITQPWGEYMAEQDRTHSPFIFADTLIRAGLNLSAVELELVMGVTPRGSYCRDLLDLSRLLDLYALLGVPVQLTIGYPASTATDMNADADLSVEGGYWSDGFSPAVQAVWTAKVAALALCKPYIRGVHWIHLTDAAPHQFPNCGLLDQHGQPRPALEQLTRLREQHLR